MCRILGSEQSFSNLGASRFELWVSQGSLGVYSKTLGETPFQQLAHSSTLSMPESVSAGPPAWQRPGQAGSLLRPCVWQVFPLLGGGATPAALAAARALVRGGGEKPLFSMCASYLCAWDLCSLVERAGLESRPPRMPKGVGVSRLCVPTVGAPVHAPSASPRVCPESAPRLHARSWRLERVPRVLAMSAPHQL